MSAEVIVKLAPVAERRQVVARAAEFDLTLKPLHPATGDPELASYLVGWADAAGAAGVVERLLRCDCVEGAYLKPPGASPETSMDRVP